MYTAVKTHRGQKFRDFDVLVLALDWRKVAIRNGRVHGEPCAVATEVETGS